MFDMQDFVNKVRSSVQNFMAGRYGGDQLGTVLVIVSLLLSILSNWVGRWLAVISLLFLVVAFARILSRDRKARQRENRAFMGFVAQPTAWFHRQKVKFDNRDTKAYVRCPHCHAEFALPKGKGKLRATCPKCGEKSVHEV